ncbi:MAG TPA: hypothetical protein VN802_13865 [Stellaceae bacterium]|nr:hypothetical protein [Stellaceae bacterium]
MKVAKCVFVGLALMLLAGCVYPDYGAGWGWGYGYGQGDYRDHGSGSEPGAEQDRSDFRFR